MRNLTLTIERGGRRQDVIVRPQAQPGRDRPARVSRGPRLLPETRRDALRGRFRPRSRVIPRESPPPPAPAAGDEAPSSLDPDSRSPTQPADAPSLESPKNQPGEAPVRCLGDRERRSFDRAS